MNNWSLPGYAELKVLGEGGFGRVVLARTDSTGVPVAIKYLFERHLADPVRLTEFRREAAVLHRVVSPYVARLYDFVETPSGAAIVMEAVPGVSLRSVLAADGMLEPEAALAVLKGSLLGLAAAHVAGIVHRDYKPDNVLVGPGRESKLVDFGLAVLAGQVGAPAGTPAYMAPEQWAGQPATEATDVYAATCVFFQCVTGRRPFAGRTTDELRAQHQYAPAPLAAAPDTVRALIARGMAKHPAQRPETASAFVTELEAAARRGYGPDWEQRGRDRLAARAAVLFAASPIAVLAAAGVTTGGTVGTASTASTAAAVGKGVWAVVGSKVIAGAIGAAVVVGSVTTAVVLGNRADIAEGGGSPHDERPSIEQVALSSSVETRTESFGTFRLDARYARISGHTDRGVQDRVNAMLMAPVDEWVEFTRQIVSGPEPNGELPATWVDAEILHQDANVISVAYERAIQSVQAGNRAGYNVRIVSIDLTTGEPLDAAHAFADAARDPVAAAELERRILARVPGGYYCPDAVLGTQAPMRPEHLAEPHTFGENPAVQVGYLPDGVRFTIFAPAFGYANVCGYQDVTVPYAEVADLMTDQAARAVIGGPRPTR
ncbi:serine/threonine-protein kinase [Prauserella oleivorans]|uniref:non-specific serine/threonine protein kinase n=1 Tax=Prauserella oleivorans TaxID=1478153 RepID=A0ABW5WGZ8_9PSEU